MLNLFIIVGDAYKKILLNTSSESIQSILKMLKKLSNDDVKALGIKNIHEPIGNGMVSIVFDSRLPGHVVKITAVKVDDNIITKSDKISAFPKIKKKLTIKQGKNEFDVLVLKKLNELPEKDIKFVDSIKDLLSKEKEEDKINSITDWVRSQKRLETLRKISSSFSPSSREFKIINNIISLIDELHSQNISFNDFKGSQFMLDPENGQIKIVDLGSVRDCEGFTLQSFFK